MAVHYGVKRKTVTEPAPNTNLDNVYIDYV